MKVGILGSGAVAKALAAGFMEHGHAVMLGTRDPAKLEDWDWKNRKGIPSRVLRQGVQLSRKRLHGPSPIQGRETDHVHLRQ